MKVFVAAVLSICMFCGCSTKDDTLGQALDLRKKLLSASVCSFSADIAADYGDIIHTFQVDCSVDEIGNLDFSVTYPESIAGICGLITNNGASLNFDDKVLAFPLQADGQISPVCAPWLFINALRGGYLSGFSKSDTGLCFYIDDSLHDYPLRFEIYTDLDAIPVHVDFVWENSRILSLNIKNFVIQ